MRAQQGVCESSGDGISRCVLLWSVVYTLLVFVSSNGDSGSIGLESSAGRMRANGLSMMQ